MSEEDAEQFMVDNQIGGWIEVSATGPWQPLWDESFESWFFFEIRSQPNAILVSPDGVPEYLWRGPFDEAEVLELTDQYLTLAAQGPLPVEG